MNVSPLLLPYLHVQHLGVWRRQPVPRAPGTRDWFSNRQDNSGHWPTNGHRSGDDEPEGETVARERLALLQDKELSVAGDLGWSLSYATAYCYRGLNSNRFAIVATINDARRVHLTMRTPFVLFDILDRCIFDGKLSGMVLLVWKAMGISHPGTTYATRVAAKRICIKLNSTPFEECIAGLSHLLEMLIHHMIHAYFLVCCGAEKPGSKQGGRMLDGLHFGVITSTINDITRDCREGSVCMTFHAAERYTAMHNRQLTRGRGSYISLEAVGTSLPAPAADGKSHCMHDNRSTTRAQVMNWQVQEYAKSIGEDWESRGDKVFFWMNGKHRRMGRLEGPPSKYYHEIIWNNKRFAVPRERVAKYSAVMDLGSSNKYGDVKLPECSAEVFKCLWMFTTYGGYNDSELCGEREASDRPQAGPPVLLSPHSRQGGSLKLHIQVCKLADTMRFSELQQYALRRLYELPHTSEDPIAVLRDIYDPTKPLSIELQSWTRKYLARSDQYAQHYGHTGLSNYEKIYDWHQARFTDIFSQYSVLREDCNIVIAGLKTGIGLGPDTEQAVHESMQDRRDQLDADDGFSRRRSFMPGIEQEAPSVVPVTRCVIPQRLTRYFG